MATLRVIGRLSVCPNLFKFSSYSRPVCVGVRSYASRETVTHTGQVFDNGDYRQLRYVDREKEVNQKFAIDLVDEEPPTEIHGRNTYCDGGGGPLGHPKVYINLDQPGAHACGYCGLRFVQAKH
ncbi:LOW QUALITY PROTEIN: NADH dehydrogenase [ubiquinone] iron-sulfur protein 6, mitochondrial-like [Amphiura filiformis]|uniref:LOW QUALITY PROTEIN: NADH dehydrogenase [ubiquinone] iron-sulfur protein 6, mitochondrial-like n=1 Tax=Amphiura filiformis TaxID=82378 RepID=UPI003B212115